LPPNSIKSKKKNGNHPSLFEIKKSSLGERLGTPGSDKHAFAYGDGLAVVLLKPGKSADILYELLDQLHQIDEQGLPVIHIHGLVSVDGALGFLTDQYAQSSTDLVEDWGTSVKVLRSSPYLNERSVRQLKYVRKQLVEKQVCFIDLQFLIGYDGRIAINDFVDVFMDEPPERITLKMIDALIHMAAVPQASSAAMATYPPFFPKAIKLIGERPSSAEHMQHKAGPSHFASENDGFNLSSVAAASVDIVDAQPSRFLEAVIDELKYRAGNGSVEARMLMEWIDRGQVEILLLHGGFDGRDIVRIDRDSITDELSKPVRILIDAEGIGQGLLRKGAANALISGRFGWSELALIFSRSANETLEEAQRRIAEIRRQSNEIHLESMARFLRETNTEFGRHAAEMLESDLLPLEMRFDGYCSPDGMRRKKGGMRTSPHLTDAGYEINAVIHLYLNNLPSLKETAGTFVHELTHFEDWLENPYRLPDVPMEVRASENQHQIDNSQLHGVAVVKKIFELAGQGSQEYQKVIDNSLQLMMHRGQINPITPLDREPDLLFKISPFGPVMQYVGRLLGLSRHRSDSRLDAETVAFAHTLNDESESRHVSSQTSNSNTRAESLADRIRRLESAIEQHADPEPLSAVYFALYQRRLITPRELELKIITGVSRVERSASVLALGDVFAEQIQQGIAPDIEILKRRLFAPDIRPNAIRAVFKVYEAAAETGREPDWEFIRKMVYRWTDNAAFEAVAEGVRLVSATWKRNSEDIPHWFLDHLSNEKADALIRALGLSISHQESAGEQSLSGLRSPDVPSNLLSPTLQDGGKKALIRTQAIDCIHQIETGALSEAEWREAIWKRDMARYVSLYGQELESWYRRTPEPTLFASNAEFGWNLKEVKQYPMTPGFERFLVSEDFLNSSILKAWTGYGDQSIYSSTLALPGEVLRQGPNILIMAPRDELHHLRPMLCAAGSRLPEGNFIMIHPPTSNAQVWEIGGKRIVTSQAGIIMRDGKWFQVYFDERNPIAFDYLTHGFSNSPGHRTKSAERLDPVLPEAKELGIPQPGSSEYADMKDVTMAVLDAEKVGIPRTLSFWAAQERLSNAAQSVRESFRSAVQVDGMSYRDLVEAVRLFMIEHRLLGIVVKPADGGLGRDVSIITGEYWDDLVHKRIAKEIWKLRAKGRSVVMQEKINSLLLDIDGEKLDWNVRVWLVPEENGQVAACGAVVRIGLNGKAVNLSIDAKAMTVDELIERLAKQHPRLKPELATLEERIMQISIDAYQALPDAPDIKGADVMVAWRDNQLTPQIIEMNGSNSGGMGSLAEHLLDLGTEHPLYRKYHGGYLPSEKAARFILSQAEEYRLARTLIAQENDTVQPRSAPPSGHWLEDRPYHISEADSPEVQSYINGTAFNMQHDTFETIKHRAQAFLHYLPAELNILAHTRGRLNDVNIVSPELAQSSWMVHLQRGYFNKLDISLENRERIAASYLKDETGATLNGVPLPSLPSPEAQRVMAMMILGEQGPVTREQAQIGAEITGGGQSLVWEVLQLTENAAPIDAWVKAIRKDNGHPNFSRHGVDISTDPGSRIMEALGLPVMTGTSGSASLSTLSHLTAAGVQGLDWAAPGLTPEQAEAVISRLVFEFLRGPVAEVLRANISRQLGNPEKLGTDLNWVQTHSYPEVSASVEMSIAGKNKLDREALEESAGKAKELLDGILVGLESGIKLRSASTFNDSAIVVTGASGFAGTAHVEYFMKRSIPVIGVDRVPPPEEILEVWKRSGLVRFETMDLVQEPEKFAEQMRATQPWAVVHMAAETDMWANRSETLTNNPTATATVITSVARHAPHARVLAMTSSSLYGNSAAEILYESLLDAGIHDGEKGAYRQSKIIDRSNIKMYSKETGIAIVEGIPFSHLGPGRITGTHSNIIRQAVEAWHRGEDAVDIPVGDRDYTVDLQRRDAWPEASHILLLRGKSGESYDICSGVGFSYIELEQVLNKLLPIEVRLVNDPSLVRPGTPLRTRGDNTRLRLLGWQPEINPEDAQQKKTAYLERMVREMIDFWSPSRRTIAERDDTALEHIVPYIRQLIDEDRRIVEQIAQGIPVTWETIVSPLIDSDQRMGEAWDALRQYKAAHDTELVNRLYKELEEEINFHYKTRMQNGLLFMAFRALRAAVDFDSWPPERQRMILATLSNFRLGQKILIRTKTELPDQRAAKPHAPIRYAYTNTSRAPRALISVDAVAAYFQENFLAAELGNLVSVSEQDGGYVSYVHRIETIKDGERRIYYLKQRLEEWKGIPEKSDPQEIMHEVKARELLGACLPSSVLPEIKFLDRQNTAFISTAMLPENGIMLNDLLKRGEFPVGCAAELGTLVARLHQYYYGNPPDVRGKSGDIEIRHKIAGTVLESYPFADDEVGKISADVIDRVKNNANTLIFTDLSPNNMVTDGTRIGLFDFETVMPGYPAFDLGIMAANVLTRGFRAGRLREAEQFAKTFHESYRNQSSGSIPGADMETLFQDAKTITGLIILYRFFMGSPPEELGQPPELTEPIKAYANSLIKMRNWTPGDQVVTGFDVYSRVKKIAGQRMASASPRPALSSNSARPGRAVPDSSGMRYAFEESPFDAGPPELRTDRLLDPKSMRKPFPGEYAQLSDGDGPPGKDHESSPAREETSKPSLTSPGDRRFPPQPMPLDIISQSANENIDSPIRVMPADDYASMRQFVRSLMEEWGESFEFDWNALPMLPPDLSLVPQDAPAEVRHALARVPMPSGYFRVAGLPGKRGAILDEHGMQMNPYALAIHIEREQQTYLAKREADAQPILLVISHTADEFAQRVANLRDTEVIAPDYDLITHDGELMLDGPWKRFFPTGKDPLLEQSRLSGKPIPMEAMIGKKLGSGVYKTFYELEGSANLVIGIMKPPFRSKAQWKDFKAGMDIGGSKGVAFTEQDVMNNLTDELNMLADLRGRNIPALDSEMITLTYDQPAIIATKWPAGLKDIKDSTRSNYKRRNFGYTSPLLVEKNITEANHRRTQLIEQEIDIEDMQPLIGEGRMAQADPLDIIKRLPSKKTLRKFDGIVEGAKRNLKRVYKMDKTRLRNPIPPHVVVTIVAVSDFHGHLEPETIEIPDPRNPSRRLLIMAGGTEYLGSAIADVRRTHANVAVVSAGDWIGSSPPGSALLRDEPAIKAANALGVQVMAPGNHEYDRGIAELLRLQRTLVQFRYVAANIFHAETGQRLFPPYEILYFDGVPVAFVGVTTHDTPMLAGRMNVPTLEFRDEADSINKLIPHLKAENIHSIVVMLHEGGNAPEPETGREKVTGKIVDIVNRLDSSAVALVIGAHTHATFATHINGIPVVQGGEYGQRLVLADLWIAKDSHRFIRTSVKTQVVEAGGRLPKDPVQSGIIEEMNNSVAVILNRRVGTLGFQLTRETNDAGESALGRFIADAFLAAAASPEKGNAQIGLVNTGSLRTGLAEGDITFSALFTAIPNARELVTLELNGKQIKHLLEQQWMILQGGSTQQVSSGFSPQMQWDVLKGGKMLQISSSLSYRWDPARPVGSRVIASSIKLNGKTIDPEQTCRIVTTSFLASGGSGYSILSQGRFVASTGMLDREAVEYQIASNRGRLQHLARIVRADEEPDTSGHGEHAAAYTDAEFETMNEDAPEADAVSSAIKRDLAIVAHDGDESKDAIVSGEYKSSASEPSSGLPVQQPSGVRRETRMVKRRYLRVSAEPLEISIRAGGNEFVESRESYLKPGTFVAIEPGTGNGHMSEQVLRVLKRIYEKRGLKAEIIVAPSHEGFGRLIRENMSKESSELGGASLSRQERLTLASLFTADRMKHNQRIISLLEQGYVVIVQRWMLTQLTHQAKTPEERNELLEMNKGVLIPDMTLIWDVDPQIAMRRRQVAVNHGRNKVIWFSSAKETSRINLELAEEIEEALPFYYSRWVRHMDGNGGLTDLVHRTVEALDEGPAPSRQALAYSLPEGIYLPRRPNTIAIDGPRGSGKTTVTQLLYELLSKWYPTYRTVILTNDPPIDKYMREHILTNTDIRYSDAELALGFFAGALHYLHKHPLSPKIREDVETAVELFERDLRLTMPVLQHDAPDLVQLLLKKLTFYPDLVVRLRASVQAIKARKEARGRTLYSNTEQLVDREVLDYENVADALKKNGVVMADIDTQDRSSNEVANIIFQILQALWNPVNIRKIPQEIIEETLNHSIFERT
jgi:5'-nucleotidase